MRLLLVVDSLDVGGAERHVVDLALALRREGNEVTVACSVGGELSGLLERADVPVAVLLRRLAKRRLSAAFAWKLRKFVKERRFDLVHAHIYASAAAATIATLSTKLPLVITDHTEAPWRSRQAQLISHVVYRRAEHIIAVSRAIRRLLVERYSVSPGCVTVISCAIAPVPDTSGASPVLPVEWQKGPLVGVIGRLQPEKGVVTLLRAAARVAPLVPKARFLVVGDGPLRRELTDLAERLGLAQRVHFLGLRLDAQALAGLLDVLVVPSITEGSPLVILEAMALATPVVGSTVGGIPDQIRHERDGLLVPPGDPVALGDALLRLLRNPAYARRLGEAGCQRAATRFSYAMMLQQIEAVYRNILREPPAQEDVAQESQGFGLSSKREVTTRVGSLR